MLEKLDMTQTLDEETYKSELIRWQLRLRELELEIFRKSVPVIITFEGWDAAGKGGAIKRITEKLDPRGYAVYPIAAPQGDERTHHYLWRFWKRIPKEGKIAIFDRTWYGRVLVERIEGFCKEEEWKRAFREINEFERQLTNSNYVLVKFWMHITREEQQARFEARKTDALKSWKLTEEDWRNREKWDLYEQGVEEMLEKTSTLNAPWTVVEGNCKKFARIKTLRTICEALDA